MTPAEELAGLRQLVKSIDEGVVILSAKGMTPERVVILRKDLARIEKRLADWQRGSANAHRT
jgi:hypothetical protein